ncbi:hypothetical protein LCL90_13820 [Bacillus infantis]|uniref:hypothetical protein n=1 Tax=Bacillus infantis TaxID=324767 RepID=UPI001CD6B1B0|nr:hypothetical protein [Bacillus infantis]MCA1035711.1 hypothetical protein [Bacillus infantis]
MSYRFKVKTTNYEWKSVSKNYYRNELNYYSSFHLEFKLRFQELLFKSKEALEFANKLFDQIPISELELYEEVQIKLSNCRYFMENKFEEKAQKLISEIKFSEDNYERYVEIINSYSDVLVRGYKENMQDTLNQVGRIATGLTGLLDDLQFTLEINGMFNNGNYTGISPELLRVNHLAEEYIRREKAEVFSLDKDLRELICA